MAVKLQINLRASDFPGTQGHDFSKGETVSVVAGNGNGRYKITAGKRFAWVSADALDGTESDYPQTPYG